MKEQVEQLKSIIEKFLVDLSELIDGAHEDIKENKCSTVCIVCKGTNVSTDNVSRFGLKTYNCHNQCCPIDGFLSKE